MITTKFQTTFKLHCSVWRYARRNARSRCLSTTVLFFRLIPTALSPRINKTDKNSRKRYLRFPVMLAHQLVVEH